MRAIMPVRAVAAGGVFMRADSIGIRLIATSHEASRDTVMVTAICTMKMLIWLVSPNRLGTNTMQWHRVPADSAMATCLVPMIEA